MKDYKWIDTDNYMIYSKLNNIDELKNKKIAAFDLDDTIIRTKSGKQFATTSNDWQLYDNSIFRKLFELNNNGFHIIIITNQNGIDKGKTDKKMWMNKIHDVINYLNTEITVFCSLKNDLYRKPRTKLWDSFINGDIDKSFFCGDAGGLDNDFSDSDLKFALNVGIKFIHRDEFIFNKKCNIIVKYPIIFDQLNNSDNKYEFIPNKPEVIINVGFPGSGKSSFTKKNILKHDYDYINQDTLKTHQKCIKELENSLMKGNSVVIDNTNLTVETRKKFIDIIKKYNINIRCIKFSTPVEICEHNSYFRNYISNGNINVIPKLVFNMMKKKLQEPTDLEGFYKINEVKFNIDLNNKEKELYCKYYF